MQLITCMIWILWVGSAISGWFQFFVWLAVPAIVFWAYSAFKNARAITRLRYNFGTSRNVGEFYQQHMTGPNIIFVAWNTAINVGIFLLAWLLSKFLGG